MDPKDFMNKLVKQAESTQATDKNTEAKRTISMSVAALNKLLQNSPFIATLEFGHAVNYGLQHNVVVRPKGGGQFRDILFRAYIPIDGFPVQLDLSGEELERCDSLAALEQRLLDFFRDPTFAGRLEQYRSQDPASIS